MLTPTNTTRSSKLIDFIAINAFATDFGNCDFCSRDRQSTHLVYRLDSKSNYSLYSACKLCTKGWQEIADETNKLVV